MSKRNVSLPQEMKIDLDRKLFNEKYFPFLKTVNNYEVYYGGSGSGKSTFIAQKLAVQMTIMPGRNLACLRRQKTDCISSCYAEIYNALTKFKIRQYWDIREYPEHKMIHRITGNVILFEGVDNIEDIKSIKFKENVEGTPGDNNLTDVWYEEVNAEPTKDSIDELDRRLRDPEIKTRIILSFNPVSRKSWLFDYVTNELTHESKDALILHSTYKDNRFLPDDYAPKLERLKYTKPYDYQVYALGNWGTTGQTVFDATKIQRRLDKISNLEFTHGNFYYEKADKLPKTDTFKFIPHNTGNITIFREPIPKHPYVMGIDTAGEGSDFYVAQVCDNTTGEQVAVFKNNKNPDECVWQCIGLAMHYNFALIAPEVNFDTWIVKALQLVDYPNLYIRETPKDKKHERRIDKIGWRTQPDNRQMMLSDMVYWTGENMDCINDVDTLNDMLTFTRQDKKLKGIWWGAESGAHDDTVMAFAVMLQAKTQQACELIPERVKLEGCWTKMELDEAVDSGRIDIFTAREYIDKYGYYAQGDDNSVPERSSRYARR